MNTAAKLPLPNCPIVKLVLCGAGAVGSLLADNLLRQGFRHVRVIDHDRVEAHNINTQLYGLSEVGAPKSEALRHRVFRSVQVEIAAVTKQLTERNARKLLKDADLVVDAFDNASSRQLVQDQCRAQQVSCLHVGLFADYGEAIWDAQYRVPADSENDICDYPLARNTVLLTVAVASEILVRFVTTGEMVDYSATLADFAVRPMER